MSTTNYGFQNAKGALPPKKYFASLFKIMRLAFVSAFMVLAMLVYILFTFNHILLPKILVVTDNRTLESPLQALLTKEQALQEELRDSDCETLKKINDRSTLELTTLVIAETIVPYETKEKLVNYVAQQLKDSYVVTHLQTAAVMNMVTTMPTQGIVSKEDVGQRGSLRTSVVLALLRTHLNNVHFMMICAGAEPRLGWRRWITPSERNSWNNVVARVLMNKVRVDAGQHLWPRWQQKQLCGRGDRNSEVDGTLTRSCGDGEADFTAAGDDLQKVVTLSIRDNNKLALQELLPEIIYDICNFD